MTSGNSTDALPFDVTVDTVDLNWFSSSSSSSWGSTNSSSSSSWGSGWWSSSSSGWWYSNFSVTTSVQNDSKSNDDSQQDIDNDNAQNNASNETINDSVDELGIFEENDQDLIPNIQNILPLSDTLPRYPTLYKLPSTLPQTWTPLLERTFIKQNSKLDLTPPNWAKPSSNENISYWLDVLPFENDKNADEYIVIPTIGVISPVNQIPEFSSDYNEVVWNGTEIKDFSYNGWSNYLRYLDNWVLQYPATLPIGLKDTSGREYVWNSVIFGHSSYWKNNTWNYKTIFGLLPTLDVWEQLWVYKKNSTGSYTLYKHKITSSYETNPSDISILLQENYDTQWLTLFTCTPIWWIEWRWVITSERTQEAINNITEENTIEEIQDIEAIPEIIEEISDIQIPDEELTEETEIIDQEEIINVIDEEMIGSVEQAPLILKKWEDYTLENDFDFCPIINSLHDEKLIYNTSWVFTDISWVYSEDEILKFTHLWVVDGYIDGTFGPNQNITRTEFLKIALVSHCYEYQDQDTSFLEYSDVDKSSWQARVIAKAQRLWMIDGDTIKNTSISVSWKYVGDWSSEVDIRELQELLLNSGIYGGDIDGKYSENLFESIYTFQRENGLVISRSTPWAWYWGLKTQKVFADTYVDIKEVKVFRPNDVISKAEAVKILMQLSKIQAKNLQNTQYTDINISWHKWYVENGEAIGLFSPQEDARVFNPNSWVQRKDMVYLIYELVQLYK